MGIEIELYTCIVLILGVLTVYGLGTVKESEVLDEYPEEKYDTEKYLLKIFAFKLVISIIVIGFLLFGAYRM
jgi:uncharacterized membrane protein YeiH